MSPPNQCFLLAAASTNTHTYTHKSESQQVGRTQNNIANIAMLCETVFISQKAVCEHNMLYSQDWDKTHILSIRNFCRSGESQHLSLVVKWGIQRKYSNVKKPSAESVLLNIQFIAFLHVMSTDIIPNVSRSIRYTNDTRRHTHTAVQGICFVYLEGNGNPFTPLCVQEAHTHTHRFIMRSSLCCDQYQSTQTNRPD